MNKFTFYYKVITITTACMYPVAVDTDLHVLHVLWLICACDVQ